MPISATATGSNVVNACAPIKAKFVGKHSKDGRLSIYLHERCIQRYSSGLYDPLRVIVKLDAGFGASLGDEQVVVVGVLGRLVCDVGLQFGEQVFLQRECAVNGKESTPLFDFDSEFVTQLPDSHHYPLTINLQGFPNLPPSLCLAASRPTDTWGISYHVYAYVTGLSAVKAARREAGGVNGWERIKSGRRHSRVFLAWTLQTPQSPPRPSNPITSGQSDGGGLLWARRSLQLSATLCKSHPELQVRVQVHNPRAMNLAGLRLSFKQLCSVRMRAMDPMHRMKTALCSKDYPLAADARAPLHDQLLILPFSLPPRLPYQVALQSQLPRLLSISAPRLFPTGRYWVDGGIEVQVEYYVNVHVVLPWSQDLLVRLPIYISAEETKMEGARKEAARTEEKTEEAEDQTSKMKKMPEMAKGSDDDLVIVSLIQ